MTISTSAGYIYVRFSPNDWNLPQGGARSMIEGIKKQIGHISKNPEGFTYDETEYVWSMKDTGTNREILEKLRIDYFEDKNQERLF